jgi:hypothetical protein
MVTRREEMTVQKIVDGVLVNLTQAEIDARLEEEAEFESSRNNREASRVRSERDSLLQETDWIVIKSYERGENIPAEWELYRQALRDITEQAGFPYSVEWPTKP